MKSISLQAILMFLILGTAFSQTEDFEDETHGDTTFTLNGFKFTTTGDLFVEVISTLGCDQSDGFLSSGTGNGSSSGSFGSIKVTNPGDKFAVSTSFSWCVFLSADDGEHGISGDILFTGTRLTDSTTIEQEIHVDHTQGSFDDLTFSPNIWDDEELIELEVSIVSNIDFLALDNIVFYYTSTNDTTSVSTIQEEEIKIYPNPAVGEIEIIGIDGFIDDLKVKIFDAFGTVVRKQSLYNQKIDISGLPNGIYFISINTDNQQITKRIIKH